MVVERDVSQVLALIAEEAHRQRISHRRLAEEIGESSASVNRWLTGRVAPRNPSVVRLMLDALGKTEAELRAAAEKPQAGQAKGLATLEGRSLVLAYTTRESDASWRDDAEPVATGVPTLLLSGAPPERCFAVRLFTDAVGRRFPFGTTLVCSRDAAWAPGAVLAARRRLDDSLHLVEMVQTADFRVAARPLAGGGTADPAAYGFEAAVVAAYSESQKAGMNMEWRGGSPLPA